MVLERLVDRGDLAVVAELLDPRPRQPAHRRRDDVPDAGQGQRPHQVLDPRGGQCPDHRADLGAQAAGADQDQALGALGELVGELHRHPAAEGVPGQGHLVDAEHGQQVAHAVGVAAERVVGPRLGRPAVTEEVGRDDGVAPRQLVDHRLPRGVVGAETVEEQQRRPGTGAHERAAVPVDGEVLDLVAAWRRWAHTSSSTRSSRRIQPEQVPAGWRLVRDPPSNTLNWCQPARP